MEDDQSYYNSSCGNVNVYTRLHGTSCRSCWDILLKNKKINKKPHFGYRWKIKWSQKIYYVLWMSNVQCQLITVFNIIERAATLLCVSVCFYSFAKVTLYIGPYIIHSFNLFVNSGKQNNGKKKNTIVIGFCRIFFFF